MPSPVRPPRTLEQALDHAIAEHQAGRLDVAELIYRRVLEDYPQHPDALHLLGLLACERGDPVTALDRADAAIARAPGRAAFHNTRARALAVLERWQEAEAAYRTAWELRPNTAEIANNLACLLRDRGDTEGAVDWFWQANRLAPGSADIVANLAQALAARGAFAASLMQFNHALLLHPDNPDALYGLGHVQLTLGHLVPAEGSFRAALRLRPDHAPSHINLGVALDRQGRGDAAAQCFRDAVRCDPQDAEAHYNLGCLLLLDNRAAEARGCYDIALSLAPLHGAALWARCMAELPPLYDSPAEIGVQRRRYQAALTDLAAKATNPAQRRALAASIGSSQPFFLPYQGQCDRDLQVQYGTLLTRLIGPGPGLEPRHTGGPITLGIVTGHAREHTLWRLMIQGWLTHIDRQRFRVHLYDTEGAPDAQTDIARRLADRYAGGPGVDIRAAILSDRPAVLLYPELGMDPGCISLAAERLAPVQCVAWGQPQTSGLPSIDWFLSSTAMEPAAAGMHYSEGLACLPNLGVVPMLQHASPADAGRAHFGLRAHATVYWCGQALYKYLPQHDAVFAEIARLVPDAQFLFIAFARSRVATEMFRERLGRAFAARGLRAEAHCVITDSMDQAHFHASVRAADIVLDSIGWSGGKSTLDMLDDAPVIVTHDGNLMRARHTAGILRCLGITDTIATTVDQYVSLAVALASDGPRRAMLRSRLAAARGWLLADLSPVRALEDFLAKVVNAPLG